jgi:TolA-binding protein
LILSPDYGVRSEAQFILSASKFHQNDYENAITEFYRTIYLFPDIPELIIDSKYYIVKSYLGLDQLTEAEAIYADIAVKLSSERKQELEKLFGEKRQNDE